MNLKKAKALRRYVRIQYPDMPERQLVAVKTAKIIGYKDALKDDGTLTKVPVYAMTAHNAIGTKRRTYRHMKKVVYGRNQ